MSPTKAPAKSKGRASKKPFIQELEEVAKSLSANGKPVVPSPPQPTDYKALAEAFVHPLRIEIYERLTTEGGMASPKGLSIMLEESLGVVAYHVKELLVAGFIYEIDTKQRRGAIEHFYTAVKRGG